MIKKLARLCQVFMFKKKYNIIFIFYYQERQTDFMQKMIPVCNMIKIRNCGFIYMGIEMKTFNLGMNCNLIRKDLSRLENRNKIKNIKIKKE